MFVEWFSLEGLDHFSYSASIAQRQSRRNSANTNGRTPNQPWRHTARNHDDNNAFHPRRSDSGTKHPAPPPEDGGFCSESSSMRLAQLPAARAARTKVLPRPRPRIRAAARQLNSKRIRRNTPPPPQGMGGTTGHRRNTHLRKMRTASHSHRPMGPRPHRQQTKLDRARTSQLQPERRTTQSNRKHRTLDTTLSQAAAATTVAANRQARTQTRHDTNESNASGQAKQAHATKTTKHTPKQEKIQSTNPPTPLGGYPERQGQDRR